MLSGRGIDGCEGRPASWATVVSANEPARKPGADVEIMVGDADADAVEKTTWMVGGGTDPNARTPLGHPPGVGLTRFNPLLWVIVLIAALVALVYVLGVVR